MGIADVPPIKWCFCLQAAAGGITQQTIRDIHAEIHKRSAPRVTQSQYNATLFTLHGYWRSLMRDWALWLFYVLWLRWRN